MFGFVAFNRKISGTFLDFSARMFGRVDDCEAEFYRILRDTAPSRIIELGGADRPIFSKDTTDYLIGVDIASDFEWTEHYHLFINDSVETATLDTRVDLVVSKYLLEHVRDNREVLRKSGEWVGNGGSSVHLFPLGFHPFSLANRIIGNRLARKLIPVLRPGSEKVTGYPAYYHLCSSYEIRRELQKLGMKYEVSYFYGAEDYFSFFFPFAVCVHIFNRFCSIMGWSIFASNAILVIKSS